MTASKERGSIAMTKKKERKKNKEGTKIQLKVATLSAATVASMLTTRTTSLLGP